MLSQTLAIRWEPGTPTLYQPQRGLPGSGTGQAPAPWLEGMEATQEPPYQHRAEHVTSQDPGLSSIQRGARPLCSSGNHRLESTFLPSPNYTSPPNKQNAVYLCNYSIPVFGLQGISAIKSFPARSLRQRAFRASLTCGVSSFWHRRKESSISFIYFS